MQYFGNNPKRSERDAAFLNSGESVSRTDPGLKGPTLSNTTGRNPEACFDSPQRESAGDLLQPKTGREFEGSALDGGEAAPTAREAGALSSFNQLEINRNSGRGNDCGG